jgi:hypothetical protein
MPYTVDHYQVVDDEQGEKTMKLLETRRETRIPKWVLSTEEKDLKDGRMVSRWYGLHLYTVVRD